MNPRLGLFAPNLGAKIIFSKSQAVMHNTIWAPNAMLSSRKN